MFFIKLLDKQGKENLGSFNNIIIKDLKTLQGVKNRLKTFKSINKLNYSKILIYTFQNVFNENTYKLVYTQEL
jgi:hypothetical protein